MSPERQVKTGAALYIAKLVETWKWLATSAPEPPNEESSDWYADLNVDAHGFSDQLCKLQSALRATVRPMVPPRALETAPIESIAIEFRSEPYA